MSELRVVGEPFHSVTTTAIALRGVRKTYGDGARSIEAVCPVDLTARRGEVVALLGPSGCGKTTLLRMIGGFIRPSGGEIEIYGSPLWGDMGRNAESLGHLGMVFQDSNLFPWLSVERNIALPLELKRVDKRQRRRRVAELVNLVGLSGFEGHWPKELSGGMRQRVAIARALSCAPDILLMDEPFGALDALSRDQMNLELQQLQLRTNPAIVFVTHSISEAVFLADRVVLFSPRPARVVSVTNVEFGRPRELDLQSELEFQAIVRDLRHQIGGRSE